MPERVAVAGNNPTSFRPSSEAIRMLDELEKHLGQTRSAVIEMAIRHFYRRELGDTAPKKKPKKRPETP